MKHAQDFDWSWAASNLLSAFAWEAYNEAIAFAWEAYNEAIAFAFFSAWDSDSS